MADRIAQIAAWLDSARPGWRTEPPADVVSWANGKTLTVYEDRYITERRIYTEFGPTRGEEILQGFEAAAAADPVAARVLAWLKSDAGVNIGDAQAEILLNGWVAAGLLTQAEADQLRALAARTVSPAEAAGLGTVQNWEIVKARGE
ncbi:hypothetical protein [Deferrisoma camini]|uniref:hypothetical protein n=1 Tax=Deferrisoma camini TaxID=1035120 RepID=UPI00046D81CB|nr:hypothetical protein [Deferrisoma camini]